MTGGVCICCGGHKVVGEEKKDLNDTTGPVFL